MAEVKRYTASIMHPVVREDPEGLLVAYHHYAELKAEVERLTKAVMHSPAAQLKLKELEGKNTYEEINPKEDENARLKAEVERLEKEVWRMKVFKGIDEDTKATLKDALNTVPEWAKVLETEAENARLKAEVERMNKAGDAMAEEIALAKRQDEGSRFDPIEMHYDHELIVKWLAAKEGKQQP
jgi:hypothetical protein